jgi:hypothetical protein
MERKKDKDLWQVHFHIPLLEDFYPIRKEPEWIFEQYNKVHIKITLIPEAKELYLESNEIVDIGYAMLYSDLIRDWYFIHNQVEEEE